MREPLRVVLAQFNALVGDIDGNAQRIAELMAIVRDRHRADILVLPELALTGYPPEDLLLRPGYLRRSEQAMMALAEATRGINVLLGFPERTESALYNACAWMRDGTVAGIYRKHALPNYAVFDEKRYFQPADGALVVDCRGWRVGVSICEDLWDEAPARLAREGGAEVILAPNASPYCLDKLTERVQVSARNAKANNLSVVYCNLVGGQDELVFDGQSFVVDAKGDTTGFTPLCGEGLFPLSLHPDDGWRAEGWRPQAPSDEDAEVWQVLQCGLRDYVDKNSFSGVLIGLSGGIDSALTAVLAADALGPERVTCVLMPSRYTATMSVEDADQLVQALGVKQHSLSIEQPFESLWHTLKPVLAQHDTGIAEQNLQSRIRGNLLMALSNAGGGLVLATSNKSELAVGYATIYGDMCGGFAPLKDCYKTRVYRLAEYRNGIGKVIPERIIQRPPSAELAAGQTDQDTLPPYPELDAILERYVERDQSIEEIAAAGFADDTVRFVAAKVLQNEYKRRQGAPGTRITPRAFGRDRRYPITSGWREGKG